MENTQVKTAKCVAKTVRVTPRKARLVIDQIRGKKVSDAYAILTFTPNGASEPIIKVLKSAAANAVNNFKMNESKLYIKTIYVTEGPRLKRYLPRAKGSADTLLKRTCNVNIVVAERQEEETDGTKS